MKPHPAAMPRLLALSFVIAVGFLLRTAFLTSKSFWMDEGFTAFMARTEWHSFIALIRTSEMNMALYYGVMRAWALVGFSEFWLRFFSVLASTATLPIVYLIGKQLADRRTGLLAASLMAAHPGHIGYAQEARSYSLEILLLTIAALCALRFVESRSTVAWSGFLVASVGAIYTHLLAVLATAAAIVPVLASRQRVRSPSVAILTFIAVLLTMPVVFFALTKAGIVASWIPPLSWETLLDSFRLVTLRNFGFLYLLAWGAALYRTLQSGQNRQVWAFAFLISWLLLPGLLLAAISIYKPIFLPRVLLICVPAACLLAALGIGTLPRAGMLIALAMTLATSLKVTASQYRRIDAKEDWRGAAAFVCAHSARYDFIDIMPGYGRFAFDYYRELDGIPEDRFIYAGQNSALPSSRMWLVVFGAVGNNSRATAALASMGASNGTRCIVQSAQFNLAKVWLLQPCTIKASP